MRLSFEISKYTYIEIELWSKFFFVGRFGVSAWKSGKGPTELGRLEVSGWAFSAMGRAKELEAHTFGPIGPHVRADPVFGWARP